MGGSTSCYSTAPMPKRLSFAAATISRGDMLQTGPSSQAGLDKIGDSRHPLQELGTVGGPQARESLR
jgi:hypothetical protein